MPYFTFGQIPKECDCWCGGGWKRSGRKVGQCNITSKETKRGEGGGLQSLGNRGREGGRLVGDTPAVDNVAFQPPTKKSDDEDRKGGKDILQQVPAREIETRGGKKMPPLRLLSSVAIIRRRRRCLRDTRGRNVGDVSVHDTCGTFLPIHHTLRYCPPALDRGFSCV